MTSNIMYIWKELFLFFQPFTWCDLLLFYFYLLLLLSILSGHCEAILYRISRALLMWGGNGEANMGLGNSKMGLGNYEPGENGGRKWLGDFEPSDWRALPNLLSLTA